MVQEELDVVQLVAHHCPKQRGSAAGSLDIHVGAVSDQELDHLVVIGGKLGQPERCIPSAFYFLLGPALGAQLV